TAKLQQKSQQDTLDHQYRTDKLQMKHGVHPLQQAANGPPNTPGVVNKVKVGSPGRPTGVKDGEPRKQRTPKPRTSAEFMEIRTWAENAQAKLTSIFSPAYLASQGKNTLRELTDVEADDLEDLKLRVLASLTPNQEVTQEA